MRPYIRHLSTSIRHLSVNKIRVRIRGRVRWRGTYVLHIEFAGALYHVTARGNVRANIDGNDDDRQQFYLY